MLTSTAKAAFVFLWFYVLFYFGSFSKLMRRIQTVTPVLVLFVVLSIYLTGCGTKFFDPTQIGRFRPVPSVNVILDSLGVAEETPSVWREQKTHVR